MHRVCLLFFCDPFVRPIETPKRTRQEAAPTIQGVSDEEVKRLGNMASKAVKCCPKQFGRLLEEQEKARLRVECVAFCG